MKFLVNMILIFFIAYVGLSIAKDKPMAIVLQNLDGEHLGFTLFHPDFLDTSGDCVFVIVPKTTGVYNSKLADYLLTMKEQGEFQWKREGGVVTVLRGTDQYLAYSANGELKNLTSGKVIGSWQTTEK